MDPNSKNMPQPGDQPSRDTRPEERPLTDNERRTRPEQDSDDDKVRRSNLAGDQDVEDTDEDDNDVER